MTMQIVLRAKGGLVLASDTKIRTTGEEDEDFSGKLILSGIINASKVCFAAKHDIAVAFAGTDGRGVEPARKLTEHLSDMGVIPEDPRAVLEKWGNEFFQSKYPGETHASPVCVLLVVIPQSIFCIAYKLYVGNESRLDQSFQYLISGNESNAAIFWPEYLGCDNETHEMDVAVRIAAYTILMGAQLNPAGVGGLEIWRYEDGWKPVSRVAVDGIRENFGEFHGGIRSAIFGAPKDVSVDKLRVDSVLRSLIAAKPQTFKEVVAKPKPRKDGGVKRSAKRPRG